MAASGIAEHNEACRKERAIMKKLAFKHRLMSSLKDELGNSPYLVGTVPVDPIQDSYVAEVNEMRKVGSPPGLPGGERHDAAYVDQMRRNELRNQQLCEYSAKIPHRFSSIDYAAQW